MKKLSLLIMTILFIGVISCRDTKKDQQKLDTTLNKIESVEKEIDNTVKEVEKKSKEVESALNELDNI